ncbi:Uma2 family endonuclease [Microcoleus sp. B4-D4]|uniref:Uma2 family endonuclease n=1 Tax=Microcoleus sp. B4-D4 TaxID=2818667 RepID=UPI002FD71FA6
MLAHGLRQSVVDSPELIQDALIVANFALCAAVDDRTICKAPDWMYVRPVQPWPHSYPRRSYTPHTEGTVPFVVMEFLSATYGDEYSVEHTEEIGKWFFYEQVIKVPRYVIFRPHTGRIEVYALESERYDNQNPDENGRYLIPGLDLFLGVWEDLAKVERALGCAGGMRKESYFCGRKNGRKTNASEPKTNVSGRKTNASGPKTKVSGPIIANSKTKS